MRRQPQASPDRADDQNDRPFPSAPFSIPPPASHERAGLPADAYPALHEWQIQGDPAWHLLQAQRVETHCRRIETQFLREIRSARARRKPVVQQPVRCVELALEFESASAAARFVDRAPTNILRAVRRARKCGGFHWEECRDKPRTPV